MVREDKELVLLHSYTLNAIREALYDKENAIQDTTITAIWLLGIFEVGLQPGPRLSRGT